MMFRITSNLAPIGALACALLMQSACGSDDAARGSAVAVNQTTHALTSGELASINGTYSGCRSRAGSWSVEIAGGATLDNPELSVVMSDLDCVLSFTELHTTAGVMTATPAIELSTLFQVIPSGFGSPVEFYANARMSSLSFAGDFVITLPYSDDPRLATRDNTASYAVVESSVTAQSVAAPNYALNVATLVLLTDVNDVVQSVSGSAGLTAGSVLGQTYVVVDATGLNTYAELDGAYLAGVDAALPASIPAVDFALLGDDLTTPQVRTVIIANISEGVASYQAFEITFNKVP